MRITSVKVDNYKCFNTPEEVKLTSGINVFIGKNNAGKTAFLEAVTLRVSRKPHQSDKTKPTVNGPVNKDFSNFEHIFEFDEGELREILRSAVTSFAVPIQDANVRELEIKLKTILAGKSHFHTRFSPDYERPWNELYLLELGDYQTMQGVSFQFDENNELVRLGDGISTFSSEKQLYGSILAPIFKSKLLFLNATRLSISQSAIAANKILGENAANLSSVIHYIFNTERELFMELEDTFLRIFPEFKRIQTPPLSNNQTILELLPDIARSDLSFSLDDLGTGVGQVLAILYNVITSKYPCVIVIDEPQSFLHPRAIHQLIEVFKKHDRHQYIISTHAPNILSTIGITNFLMVKKQKFESTIEPINQRKEADMRACLDEVGASLSDVVGVDNVLWVEGKTEERSFPLIVSDFMKDQLPFGAVKILGATETSFIDTKDPTRVLDLHRRLSEGSSLIPPAIGFIFDREFRSDEQITELKRLNVLFFERRMYENYLLHPSVIAPVLRQYDNENELITVARVTEWLNTNKWFKKYFVKIEPKQGGEENIAIGKQNDAYWYQHVHGPRILRDIANDLTENRVDYNGNKASFGTYLTEQILIDSDHRHELEEIGLLLKGILAKKLGAKE